MSCNSNCFINCADGITSDQCVQYTGPDVPALGICQGDQVSTVEQVILTELQNALSGTGIVPENVTLENCQWLADQFVGENPNLSNLLQLLIDNECTLKDMIDTINSQIVTQNGNFNTLCLQGLPANPTVNDILQSVINTVCSTNLTISTLPDTYVKNDDINTIIQQQIQLYLTNSQTGQIEYFQYFPLKVAMPYFGDLGNFDNTGKGLSSAGMTNFFLCNGLNGTPDLRGKTLVGAVKNVPGATFDSIVDPANPDNPNWGFLDTQGENKHLITITETPTHTHGVTDPGHKHNILRGDSYTGSGDMAHGFVGGGQSTNPQSNAITLSALTGITLQNAGGGQKHNNIQPSLASYWIIRML